jgi:hypothetical protein
MNPHSTRSIATLMLAGCLAFAAGAAPAREARVGAPHETKARASFETCSSEPEEKSSSSTSAKESSRDAGDITESKVGDPAGAGGNGPPQ